ncbi:putative homoserine O-acetyltransferase [Microsporum audouinii]
MSNTFEREPKSVTIPSFQLENHTVLKNVRVVYHCWGYLSAERNNCLVVCHPSSLGTDVSSWWTPLLGGFGHALDTSRYFIICMNVLGSPFGSTSPLTAEGDIQGAKFPLTTIRDDVRIHRLVLEILDVRQVCMVIGHSMGGMHALEWAFHGAFVQSIVPIATTGTQSGWGIGWSEAQRQNIFSDRNYQSGEYHHRAPPVQGLRAARMAALLIRRSKYSADTFITQGPRCSPSADERGPMLVLESSVSPTRHSTFSTKAMLALYQESEDFARQFDANCYITLTRKTDTHDVGRGRSRDQSARQALKSIIQPVLIIGVESDLLHPIQEQQELADAIPNSKLRIIESAEGHDTVLFGASTRLNDLIISFQQEVIPHIYS